VLCRGAAESLSHFNTQNHPNQKLRMEHASSTTVHRHAGHALRAHMHASRAHTRTHAHENAPKLAHACARSLTLDDMAHGSHRVPHGTPLLFRCAGSSLDAHEQHASTGVKAACARVQASGYTRTRTRAHTHAPHRRCPRLFKQPTGRMH